MPTNKPAAARELAEWVRDAVRNGGIDAKDVALGRDLIARYDAARELAEAVRCPECGGDGIDVGDPLCIVCLGTAPEPRAALEGGDDA